MRRLTQHFITSLLLCLLVTLCQAETYDALAFEAPQALRQKQLNKIEFMARDGDAFIQYIVGHSLPSSGDAGQDFQIEWQSWAMRHRELSDVEPETVTLPDGWKMTVGAARLSIENWGEVFSVLSVFSGHGIKASVIVNTNHPQFHPQMKRFLASLKPIVPIKNSSQ